MMNDEIKKIKIENMVSRFCLRWSGMYIMYTGTCTVYILHTTYNIQCMYNVHVQCRM
jgi:hypothetical protein